MIAICKLSIVPIRKSPSDQSEQVSQLLFGEQVFIENQKKDWYAVKCIHDDYQGFVDKKQVNIISKLMKAAYIVNVPFLQIFDQNIVLGSYINEEEIMRLKSLELGADYISNIKKPIDASYLIKNAKKFLNTPYLWGGRSPMGVDCSGFTQIIYRLSGINLKRDAYQQAELGKPVESLNNLRSGDLAFFNKGKNDKITHVGLVIKEDNQLKIIHASGWVQINDFNIDGIWDKNGELSHHYLFSRRIIQ